MSLKLDIPGLPNLQNPASGYASGGQPGPEQLETAARIGIRRIINLRPPSEDAGFDEAEKTSQLGLDYSVLGIAGLQDLNLENVRKFDALLAQNPDTPTLVHCASGNRVGALMALRAAWLQGKPKAEALEIGRRWGLTKMEAAVSQLLS